MINFESSMNALRDEMGPTNLTQYLSRSIAMMVFGSNDYLGNYLMPLLYNSSYNYNPQDYANLLLNHYTRQILVINLKPTHYPLYNPWWFFFFFFYLI